VSSFGTGGIVDTGLGGSGPGQQALVRGIAYNSDVNASHHGVVAIVGAVGNYGSTFHPFIATFDQQTGAAYGSSATVSSISGTAVGVAYDTSTTAYYIASTETSATNHFYVNKFYHPVSSPTTLTQINASTTYANSTCDSQCSLAHCQDVSFNQDASLFQCDAGPYWDTAVDFTTAISGGAAHSVPNTIAVFGSDVVVGGSNKVSSSTPPWRCALVALNKTTGSLDTSFGSVPLSGGTNSRGISLFSHEASPSNDCIVNNVLPKGGTQLFITGTAYTAGNTNYDYLAALFNSSGALVGSFGNGTVAGTETFGLGPSDDVLNATTLVNSGSNAIVVGRSSDVSGYQGGDVQYFDTSTGGIAPTLQSLSLSASLLGVAVSNTSAVTVTATFSDSTQSTIAVSSFNWASSNTSRLTVSNGTVTPLTGNSAIGTSTITSSIAGITTNTTMTNPGFLHMKRAVSPGYGGTVSAQASAVDSSGNSYVGGYTDVGLNGTAQTGDFDGFVAKYNSSGTLQWVAQVGATGYAVNGNAVSVDASGNSYLAGITTGGLNGNTQTGYFDLFVAKFNSFGALQWVSQTGPTSLFGMAFAYGVSVDASGNSYAVGYTTGDLGGNTLTGSQDFFVVKYNSSGTQQWLRLMGAASSTTLANGCVVDASGNSFVVGATSGALNGNSQTGDYDFFIAKYNSSGTLQWLRQLGAASTSSQGYGVSVDSSGNTYLAGHTSGGLNGNSLTGFNDFFVAKYNASGTLQWVRQMGRASSDSYGKGVGVDASGNSFVAGYTTGGLNGNSQTGTNDFFVAKYNTSGTLQWLNQTGLASKTILAFGISANASGQSFVAGYTNGGLNGNTQAGGNDLFIAKYSSAGALQWLKQKGASTQETRANAVALDTSGNSYVGGYTAGSLNGNALTGAKDFFIDKYSSSGALQWSRQLGAASVDSAIMGLAVDASGNIYGAGYTFGGLNGNSITGLEDIFVVKYNASGTLQWLTQIGAATKYSSASSVAVDSSGNVYVGGTTLGGLNGNTRTGFSDFVIAKYNAAGTLQWLRQMGKASKLSETLGVAADASGNSFISGHTTGGLNGLSQIGDEDVFVAKYNTSGTLQWLRQVGAASTYAQAYSISVDASGNSYAAGTTSGGLNGNTVTGYSDFFVLKYNASGTLQWLRQTGAANNNSDGRGISVDSSGNSYVAGYTTDGLNGNSQVGVRDLLIAKYNTSGTLQWLQQMGVASRSTFAQGVTIDASGNSFVAGYGPENLDGNLYFGAYQYFLIKYDNSGLRQ
jgi:uncharacterized delta-60 repeat protein